MSRKITILCILMSLLLGCFYAAHAAEIDLNKKGSISVTLIEQKHNKPIVGAVLNVYYVAAATTDVEGNLIFDYTEDFEPLDISIDDMSLSSVLEEFAPHHSIPFTKMITDTEGATSCEKLPAGLYFIQQSGTVEGFSPCKSFLVTIPYEERGEYVFEVDASPKTDVERLTSVTIKKVWNVDASTDKADNVTVQLLKNGDVLRTAVLNAQNNWQVTYINMPESDVYSIKEVNVPTGFVATYKQEGYIFTVTNTSSLIQAGQLLWPIPVLAICGMLLIAAGIAFLQRKRDANA